MRARMEISLFYFKEITQSHIMEKFEMMIVGGFKKGLLLLLLLLLQLLPCRSLK